MRLRVCVGVAMRGLTRHVVDTDCLLEVLEVGHHLGEEGSLFNPDHRRLLLDVGLGAERRGERREKSYCS